MLEAFNAGFPTMANSNSKGSLEHVIPLTLFPFYWEAQNHAHLKLNNVHGFYSWKSKTLKRFGSCLSYIHFADSIQSSVWLLLDYNGSSKEDCGDYA